MCLMPFLFMNCSNSVDVNCGPLPDKAALTGHTC